MPKRAAIAAAFAGLLIGATATPAQQLDCSNPQSQVEMTGCAAQAFEAADGDLNLAWRIAMEQARRLDEVLREGEVPAVDILRDAQRAWITFRDKGCEAESLMARGGTLQNQLYFICLERETRQRTEALRLFGEVN